MINLEEITIKISPELAQIYRQASTETQAQIQSKITALLESQIMSYHQEKLKKFRETMDKCSEEAQANGLTPEILKEILADTNE
ncbi:MULTISPECIES: hypothetical protein [Crocosphaera]|uniref:Uncharacterized protein n=2 Tax=Crocosphaera watsonii TaxID=263511 RepID=T2JJQ2_CROWT|nr:MULTISPECIES: hypothetical protein [Crocosphaera]MCH2243554.1 hypothetical protein [Crocosphaera sp.]NQZ62586.1 hypothetical protein [Crocosphaera sp.]CCQ65480.1 hypothetical protein CWATWH0402_674 [Crocosphaera watsonii WH 0402]